MIKTIIFDNNGVLTNSDKEETLVKISNFLRIDLKKISDIWSKESENLDLGIETTENFLKRFLSKINSEQKYDEILKLYLSSYVLKKEVCEFAIILKKDFEIALLSNFGDWFDEFNAKWN